MPFATAEPLPLLGNLVGLPNGWARGLGALGSAGGSYVDDFCSAIEFTTTELVLPGGNILLFFVASEDGVRWTDGIDPNSSFDQSARIGVSTQANLVQRLPGLAGIMLPNTRYCFNNFSIKMLMGGTPTFWSPLIWNLVGGPLSFTISPIGSHTLQT